MLQAPEQQPPRRRSRCRYRTEPATRLGHAGRVPMRPRSLADRRIGGPRKPGSEACRCLGRSFPPERSSASSPRDVLGGCKHANSIVSRGSTTSDRDHRMVAEAIAPLERHNAGRHRRSEGPTDGYALRKCQLPPVRARSGALRWRLLACGRTTDGPRLLARPCWRAVIALIASQYEQRRRAGPRRCCSRRVRLVSWFCSLWSWRTALRPDV
jgi:hypothetical protein